MIKGIEGVVEPLATELRKKVDNLVELEELREECEAGIDIAKRDIKRIRIALEALTGNTIPVRVNLDEEIPVESSAKLPGQAVAAVAPYVPQPEPVITPPAPRRVPDYPPCQSCGSESVYLTNTTMPKSGRVIQMLVCGECKNERPLGVVG